MTCEGATQLIWILLSLHNSLSVVLIHSLIHLLICSARSVFFFSFCTCTEYSTLKINLWLLCLHLFIYILFLHCSMSYVRLIFLICRRTHNTVDEKKNTKTDDEQNKNFHFKVIACFLSISLLNFWLLIVILYYWVATYFRFSSLY